MRQQHTEKKENCLTWQQFFLLCWQRKQAAVASSWERRRRDDSGIAPKQPTTGAKPNQDLSNNENQRPYRHGDHHDDRRQQPKYINQKNNNGQNHKVLYEVPTTNLKSAERLLVPVHGHPFRLRGCLSP